MDVFEVAVTAGESGPVMVLSGEADVTMEQARTGRIARIWEGRDGFGTGVADDGPGATSMR